VSAGGREGFTLIELIVALVLSAFVLVGIVGVATQMIRFQMEGHKKGDVTGWTLLSLAKMNKELEDASVLDFPPPGLPPADRGDHISGCSNYTRGSIPPGPIDASLPVTAFWYCVQTDWYWEEAKRTTNRLLRYSSIGSCPAIAPSCGSEPFEVYALDFYKRDGLNYFFRRADDVSGVEVNYTVGIATAADAANANMPNPVFIKVQAKIGMNKSYNNTAD
jgi:prepilin-type N-terminal cleavage/methylation domain-containing protein